MYEAITAGDKDFSAISKMKQANIDAILFWRLPDRGGLIVRQARDQGLQARLIGADALSPEEFWKITGPAGERDVDDLPSRSPQRTCRQGGRRQVHGRRIQNPEGYTLYNLTRRSRPLRLRRKRLNR